jgi:hypothetical protein
VAGHTDISTRQADESPRRTKSKRGRKKEIAMSDYELRLAPNDRHAALQIARRPDDTSTDKDSTNR